MLNMNLSALVAALDDDSRLALEGAAEACVNRGGHEIGIEDYFEKLTETTLFIDICRQFEINVDTLKQLLSKNRKLDAKASGRPVFAAILVEFLQEAYLYATLEMKQPAIDAGVLVLALLVNPARYCVMPFYRELEKIGQDKLRQLLQGLNGGLGGESGASSSPKPGGGENALAKYATDFTEEARQGKVDPVFARGDEIRQVIDILTRRRKNNPILVGDPGVGKTAVAEGLALKISLGEVPKVLQNVRLVGLDMGRLQAGASVKGEFEKRLKAVIDEVKSSPTPTILFIDEAHTLVGSGNAAGGSDGANLLKPALARGELRTLAATTWSEYKKYFEKDAALARRFQLVKLDEPSTEQTVAILRGLAPNYEKSHQVYVRDDAVLVIAELSARYISGRYLPDKAIDVLDTACARVKVSLGAKPVELDRLEDELNRCQIELSSRERDEFLSGGTETSEEGHETSKNPLPALRVQIAELKNKIDSLENRWSKEKALVEKIIELRAVENRALGLDFSEEVSPEKKLSETETPETAALENETPAAADADHGEILESAPATAACEEAEANPLDAAEAASKIKNLQQQLKAMQGDQPLVFYEVDVSLATGLISEWTGIPVEKLRGGGETIKNLGPRLRQRIRGQQTALASIEKSVLTVFAGLENPNTPNGIFLLVGPSGVGKTETALAVAEELFGGERFLISINMSEFQEKHTISRLIGSPPGYVGYGEGGRLTEAVRRQPYSAVLFDEVEKAHPDILNLFYQMFDKGTLADGEGREIDFRNTTIFMTSNLGSDIIAALCEDEEPSSLEMISEALRPALSQFFKPALLSRFTVVPYLLIKPDILKELVDIKLNQLKERMSQRRRLELAWTEAVTGNIVDSCTAVDSGARNIDHVMNAALMPQLAAFLLGDLKNKSSRVKIDIDLTAGNYLFEFI